jgi:hypothetical protein
MYPFVRARARFHISAAAGGLPPRSFFSSAAIGLSARRAPVSSSFAHSVFPFFSFGLDAAQDFFMDIPLWNLLGDSAKTQRAAALMNILDVDPEW